MWNLQGNQLATFAEQQEPVIALKVSPDGRHIAAIMENGMVRVWDIRGNLLSEFKGHQGEFKRIKFSHDGNQVITVTPPDISRSLDAAVKLWDLQGNLIKTIQDSNFSTATQSI